MATVKNKWIGFLDRSYIQIKNSLLGLLPSSNPEMTDHSSSNPFIILVDMFAGTTENLNYYVDNVAEESFIATASRRSSIIKHAIGLDYRIKARNPESVDLILNFTGANPTEFTILVGSSIVTTSGYRYILETDITVPVGVEFITLPLSQLTPVNSTLGISNGAENQEFRISNSYVHKSMQVTIAGESWDEVETFAHSNLLDKHYVVDIKEDGFAYIRFGDGEKGEIPLNNQNIEASYKNTSGVDGKVNPNSFDENTLSLLTSITLPVTIEGSQNPLSSSGGVDFEDTESIRINSVRSLRTLDRAIVARDYIDLLESLPGVDSAAISYCCGKDINLYIVPSGGGIAQQALINETQTFIQEKATLLLKTVVQAAGEARLFLRLKVYAKPRKGLTETSNQVREALLDYNNLQGIGINSRIRISDIQGLVDNLDNVDYVDLLELYLEPYARPIGTQSILQWDRVVKPNATDIKNYRVEVDLNGDFIIFKDNTVRATISQGQTYSDPDDQSFQFTINPGAYNPGDRWDFKVYPYLTNISITDFSIARITEESLSILVVKSENPETSQIC